MMQALIEISCYYFVESKRQNLDLDTFFINHNNLCNLTTPQEPDFLIHEA